jgi:AraC-like DNA-binding protein
MHRDLAIRLSDSRDFIAENFATDVSLADAADIACISVYHYHRLFAARFGMTPHQFKSQQRFDRAKKLLIESDYSVSEIAFLLGYESPASFSTLFRRRFGMNPSEFREVASRSFALGKIWSYKFIPHCFIQSA